MSRRRRFHYSASLAMIVTALAVFFYKQGGEVLLVPGMMLEGILELALTLLLTTGDDFYFLPRGSHVVLNAVFYFHVFYMLSCCRTDLREGLRGR
ncbi:MAG TPA: hypothetical protein VFZ44_10720 [Pyrinomonadaceae bacterium]